MPVVHRLADAAPRRRVVTTGRIASAEVRVNGSSHAYCCVLDDGTGEITLVFTGRKNVPGLVAGTLCRVEGTAGEADGSLVLRNPWYEFQPEKG
ncbi:MAG: OB-fold nucleic acid binding domain-containing protein [Acidimicrobiaceae bacterium]|nr:OB-fold nucleic acid binding domain-containing protein [Acidimicrobiaceae bacterium]